MHLRNWRQWLASGFWLIFYGLFGAIVVIVLAGGAALAVYNLLRTWFGLTSEQAAGIAIPVAPSLIMALFTVALWRATWEQARATRDMRKLQERLVRVDTKPMLALGVVYLGFPRKENPLILRLLFEYSKNLGKYGVQVKRVELWIKDEKGRRYILGHTEEISDAVSLTPGEAVWATMFELELLSEKKEEILRLLDKHIQGRGDSSRELLIFRLVVIHGGDPGRPTNLCFRLLRTWKGQFVYPALGERCDYRGEVMTTACFDEFAQKRF